MADAGGGTREEPDFPIVKLDAMGVPNIVADPTDAFGILARPLPKGLQAEVDILVIFSQVRMQLRAVRPR